MNSIAFANNEPDRTPSQIVTASRDRSLLVWNLDKNDPAASVPVRRLKGHSHFVQDVVISSDGLFALSASWDKTLRLWDCATGQTSKRFTGHQGDVLSVAFSADNRQIVSASRDKTVKLWNTLGECKYTLDSEKERGGNAGGHTDWVSCVRFSPAASTPLVVSCGWDKMVKVWKLTNFTLKANLIGHTGYVNTVAISPDGHYLASGGKDGKVLMWDLRSPYCSYLYSLDAGDVIHSIAFSPTHFWVAAATSSGFRVWDMDSKNVVVDMNKNTYPAEFTANTLGNPACVTLAWMPWNSKSLLLTGHSDENIRVWEA